MARRAILSMPTIHLSTGAVFSSDEVVRVRRFRESVPPAEPNAEGGSDEPTEREVLVIEMHKGPDERVVGEHAAIDAARLSEAGFRIETDN